MLGGRRNRSKGARGCQADRTQRHLFPYRAKAARLGGPRAATGPRASRCQKKGSDIAYEPTAGGGSRGVEGAVRDEGGAVPGEGDGWCVCAWVAKVSLKPTNGAGRRLHTCAPTVARREPILSRAGYMWEICTVYMCWSR